MLSTNDNYCVIDPVLVTRSLNVVPSVTETNKTVIAQTNVTCSVVSHVHFATKSLRQPQKKGLSPPLRDKVEINSVKCVSFVDHCVSVPTVPNVPSVAHAQLVGGRLQLFWQTWALLCMSPRVVSILKEGYVLPFKLRPPLVRDPLIVSGYANPSRNLYLKEALQALL